jgi:hypothetical protein
MNYHQFCRISIDSDTQTQLIFLQMAINSNAHSLYSKSCIRLNRQSLYASKALIIFSQIIIFLSFSIIYENPTRFPDLDFVDIEKMCNRVVFFCPS